MGSNGTMQLNRSIASSPNRSPKETWKVLSKFSADCLAARGGTNVQAVEEWLGRVLGIAYPLLVSHQLEQGAVVVEMPGLRISFQIAYGLGGMDAEDVSLPSLSLLPSLDENSTLTLTFEINDGAVSEQFTQKLAELNADARMHVTVSVPETSPPENVNPKSDAEGSN
ncbi:hypothetical protein HYR54_15835 [Candidatus Acetothermia bacterium]|nr:hypothetical protein [Candidatus Acetothermia bacterium]